MNTQPSELHYTSAELAKLIDDLINGTLDEIPSTIALHLVNPDSSATRHGHPSPAGAPLHRSSAGRQGPRDPSVHSRQAVRL